MSDPYIGEVRMFGGSFAPVGWEFCNGQLLPISQNDVLFTLIGTTYGGDGTTTFGLPDLRGRLPLHAGVGAVLGQAAGAETVTLTSTTMPSHTHPLLASSGAGDSTSPTGKVWAAAGDMPYTATLPPNATMHAGALQSAGSSQPHENMPPFLAISFIIATAGRFPSQ
jgi:microcystin-dependent protein